MTIILKGIMGSHCHNLNTPLSDIDIRGVVVKSEPEYLFGVRTFEQMVTQNDETDITLWELRKFVRLCLKGNTNGYNLLFCEERSITAKNDLGCRLREIRHKFLSNRLYAVLRGYHIHEHRLAIGETTGRLGEKRKVALKERGYSYKNASHCLRLLHTGAVTFKTGTFPVWLEGDYRDILYEMKIGEISRARYDVLYEDAVKEFEAAFHLSKLNPTPLENEIWDEVLDYYKDLVVAGQ